MSDTGMHPSDLGVRPDSASAYTERMNALISEIEQQRNWALTRCAAMAAEITELRKKIEQAEQKEEAE